MIDTELQRRYNQLADLMRGLHASLDDQEVWSARAYAEQITAAVQRLEAENERLREKLREAGIGLAQEY